MSTNRHGQGEVHRIASGDPLEGTRVRMPDGHHALVLAVEHEYDDGTTLRIIDGPCAGDLSMRDTYSVRKWPVV